MKRNGLLAVAILTVFVVLIASTIYYFMHPEESTKPSWLMPGAYVTFAQAFKWNEHSETQFMTWELTGVNGDYADLHLLSHGVSVSGGNVTVVPGESEWRIDTVTREIVNSSDANYVGKKCPFWIQTDVKAGSLVETFYGATTISRSERVEVLGEQRDCWILEYNWPTSSMKRWYDKSSGICIKIQVIMHQQDLTIVTTETAALTNIGL